MCARDAWYAQRSLSRTEAKKRYIETLIETMYRYASQTPEARELVAELEFVWNQIRANATSSSSGSSSVPSRHGPAPVQGYTQSYEHRYGSIDGRLHSQQTYGQAEETSHDEEDEDDDEDLAVYRRRESASPSRLRVLSPVSQPTVSSPPRDGNDHATSGGDTEDDDDEEEEEFVEARSSPPRRRPRKRDRRLERIEDALTTLKTEIAALREQLTPSPRHERFHHSVLSWIRYILSFVLGHFLWDLALFGALYIVLRVRKRSWENVRDRLRKVIERVRIWVLEALVRMLEKRER